MVDNRESTLGEDVVSVAVGGGAILLLGYGLYKARQWWQRNEEGPAGGFGVGFGVGNGGFNLNPFDKGKAGTGDGGSSPGSKWERATVLDVKGWRRKGVPLPFEEGGPGESYQYAVLIMTDGSAIPDVSSWPDTLPVFLVHDAYAPYPDVDGGWRVTATFGNRAAPKPWIFDCAATDSKGLTACVRKSLEETLSGAWG